MAARFALPAAVVIVALLAIVAAAPPPAAAQEAAQNGTTTIAFDLHPDGDATVSVTLRLHLDDESDGAAFDRLADEHESGGDSGLSVQEFERAASLASAETGRPMEVRDVSPTADRSNGTGVLDLTFTWTNFTRVENGRLFLGDVFQRPGGTWLPGLESGQELRISFPERYSTQDISMGGTGFQIVNRTIHVEGPASFEPGTPAVVLEGPGASTGPPAGLSTEALLVLVALIVLVGGGLLAYYFRDGLSDLAGTGSAASEPEAAAEAPEEEEVDPMSEPLLSDEERVLKLLETRDGRMKQVEIVEATDWSNAKVSQLLSEMEEAGQVDKLRIGRENLISLPGHGPGSE